MRPQVEPLRAETIQSAAPEEPAEGECIICADDLPTSELIRPEGCPETEPPHYYCKGCMKMAFEGALRDEAMFPVRCCPAAGPFNLAQVRHQFDQDFRRRFALREAEMKSRDRIYCHRQTCSAFIRPEDIQGDMATCRACRSDTCVRCKKQHLPGEECPEVDKDTKDTLELGKAERWQRCPFCTDLVDLHSGCNHVCKFDL